MVKQCSGPRGLPAALKEASSSALVNQFGKHFWGTPGPSRCHAMLGNSPAMLEFHEALDHSARDSKNFGKYVFVRSRV